MNDFKTKRDRIQFAKFISLLTIYQQDPEWEADIYTLSKKYCERELNKMGLPEGWGQLGSYDAAKAWFLEWKTK